MNSEAVACFQESNQNYEAALEIEMAALTCKQADAYIFTLLVLVYYLFKPRYTEIAGSPGDAF